MGIFVALSHLCIPGASGSQWFNPHWNAHGQIPYELRQLPRSSPMFNPKFPIWHLWTHFSLGNSKSSFFVVRSNIFVARIPCFSKITHTFWYILWLVLQASCFISNWDIFPNPPAIGVRPALGQAHDDGQLGHRAQKPRDARQTGEFHEAQHAWRGHGHRKILY